MINALQDVFVTVSGAARGEAFLCKADEINERRIGIAEKSRGRLHASTNNNPFFHKISRRM